MAQKPASGEAIGPLPYRFPSILSHRERGVAKRKGGESRNFAVSEELKWSLEPGASVLRARMWKSYIHRIGAIGARKAPSALPSPKIAGLWRGLRPLRRWLLPWAGPRYGSRLTILSLAY